jgi:hypothetical protein
MVIQLLAALLMDMLAAQGSDVSLSAELAPTSPEFDSWASTYAADSRDMGWEVRSDYRHARCAQPIAIRDCQVEPLAWSRSQLRRRTNIQQQRMRAGRLPSKPLRCSAR